MVAPTRDAAEIKALHKHLFQDVYDWAGELRIIDMRRGNGEHFAPWQHVPFLLNQVMDKLAEHHLLKGLKQERFVDALTQFYDELNFIHPFREGNGRMQRTFWSRVAFSAGWVLDWRTVYGEELNETSRIAREELDRDPLHQALSKCVSPVTR